MLKRSQRAANTKAAPEPEDQHQPTAATTVRGRRRAGCLLGETGGFATSVPHRVRAATLFSQRRERKKSYAAARKTGGAYPQMV